VKWVQRWRASGTCAPRPQGVDKRSGRIEAHAAEILGLVATRCDITLAEVAAHLEETHGERLAPSTVWRFLDRHDQTFKKTAHASEQQRPDVAPGREAWRSSQSDLDPARLVFVEAQGAPEESRRAYDRRVARRHQEGTANVHC
jgi:hypothetical protein